MIEKLLAKTDIIPEIGDPSTWGLPQPKAVFQGGTISIATYAMEWILGFIGIFAVGAVLYSGFMYITAGGNSDQAEKAKKNLTWAIIGIILVVLSTVVVQWVQTFLTTNV